MRLLNRQCTSILSCSERWEWEQLCLLLATPVPLTFVLVTIHFTFQLCNSLCCVYRIHTLQAVYQQPQDRGWHLDFTQWGKPQRATHWDCNDRAEWIPDGSCLCVDGVHSSTAQELFHLHDELGLRLCPMDHFVTKNTNINKGTFWKWVASQIISTMITGGLHC